MKIKLNKDYKFSHDGFRLVEYMEGQETSDIPEEVCQALIERGDACECKAIELKVEEPTESPKEPEENKLMEPKENKVSRKKKK